MTILAMQHGLLKELTMLACRWNPGVKHLTELGNDSLDSDTLILRFMTSWLLLDELIIKSSPCESRVSRHVDNLLEHPVGRLL